MAEKDDIVWVRCSTCGGRPRNHRVIYSHHIRSTDNTHAPYLVTINTMYETVTCLGCNAVRFRISETRQDDCEYDEETGDIVYTEHEQAVYPDDVQGHRQPEESSKFPKNVAKMYVETIKCFNTRAFTLAGGGLRAIVEAICQDRQVIGRDLAQKIDALVEQKYLVPAQADLLHEERYIGNFALHEMKTPTKEDLEYGLQIIEGLLKTIYVLPDHAARLRAQREKTDPPIHPPA